MQEGGQENVLFLEHGWNYLTVNSRHETLKRLRKKDRDHAKIIHYASLSDKPWLGGCDLSEHWWKYAKMTPFYEKILYEKISQMLPKKFRKKWPMWHKKISMKGKAYC
jgi:hypothetical protein